MDLIGQGVIVENFIEPSYALVDTFNIYWTSIMPAGAKTSMAYPFPRLKTDGFWHLIPKFEYENQINIDFNSMTRLRKVCAGARMDDELFQFLCNPETREQLRVVLIKTYFAPKAQPLLLEQGRVNYEAYEYGKRLLADPEREYRDEETEKSGKARDQGFRKTIVLIYNHRCALCGIRMLTPEGHTVVEAAHIKPWHESQDDRPTNGMSLCRLCHWYFDEGLMSVGGEYQVLVSKRIQVEKNLPGHILTLSDRSIFTPEEHKFWPDQNNLDWHRQNFFRR